MRQMDPTPFFAGARGRSDAHPPGISNNTPFTESWRLALNSRDLEDKAQRVSDKPFLLAATKRGGMLFQEYQHSKNMERLKRSTVRQQTVN